jgi:hypothetical protein
MCICTDVQQLIFYLFIYLDFILFFFIHILIKLNSSFIEVLEEI